MAKVKSGGIRNLIGRVGGNVYYMNKGQNIARELAPAISNPQTAAQQEQRMRWANLVSFYRANQPWQKRGAFESKKQTWSDYNAFVSANSKVSPVYLTKQQAEQGGAVVAPYIVTKGSLPSVSVVSDETNEQFVSDLYVGDLTITGTTTAAELSAALRQNNNGLQEGDQISFILNLQSSSAQGVPFITARYYEFIIDSSDDRPLADIGLEGVIVDDTYEDMQRLCLVHDGAVCGGTIIVSRTTSGNIKVSTQSLVLNASMQAYLADYTSEAALQRAARSYGENDPNFLAAGYSGKASNVAVPVGISILTLNDNPVGSTLLQNGTILKIGLSDIPQGGDVTVIMTGRRYVGDAWGDYSNEYSVGEINVAEVNVDFGEIFFGYFTRLEVLVDATGESVALNFRAGDEDITP